MSGAVVGDDQIEVLNDGGGDDLLMRREPLGNELVAAALPGLAQGEVTGQRWLAVQIEQ